MTTTQSITADCGYAAAVEGSPCTHECGEECAEACTHVHDELCGYVEAAAEVPCGYVCEESHEEEPSEEPDPVCICETKCADGSVNSECAVCSVEGADLSGCVGEEATADDEVKQTYAITVNASQNGSVIADEYAIEGDTVTLYVSPYLGYVLDTLSVTDAEGNAVTVENNKFTMPASAVTVSAAFVVCDHKDSQYKYYDNGDGYHDATCTACHNGSLEPHTIDSTTGECEKCGAKCTHNNFDSATGNCTDCVTPVAIAKIKTGETTIYYQTAEELSTAVRSYLADQTITLLADFAVITDLNFNSDSEAKNTLDLNGHTIYSDYSARIAVYCGELTITGTGSIDVFMTANDEGAKIVVGSGVTLNDTLRSVYGGVLDLSNATIPEAGLNVILYTDDYMPATYNVSDVLLLPEDYYFFVDGKVVSSYSEEITGTVLKHTDHSYNYTDNGDGMHDATCTACGAVVEDEAHSGGTATCTEQAECQHCGASYGEVNANNHNWENGVCTYECGITHDPHSFENGICTVCGMSEGPVELAITQQPTDSEAKLGENYCVEVIAQGEGLKYQWYFRNAGTDVWHKSGVTDNTYDDVMTTARAGREVYCVITDADGNSVTTDTAKLIAVKTVELAITQQPNDSSAKLDEMFCVEVLAEGDGLQYQWYWRQIGDENWNLSGQRDNTYDDVMTSARHNREVYCVITDAWGDSVTTEIATITGTPTTTLAITRQPENQSVTIGDMFNVTFEAQGDGLKYQWYFRQAGTEVWYTSAQKDNSYDDVMTKARHNRELYCIVTDAWGNTVETDPIVVILATPRYELAITAQPENESVKMGEMFCVTVEAQGDELKYQWYWRNVGSENWNVSGQRDNTYDDVMTKARHNREVKCVITDMWGESVETEIATITAIPDQVLAIVAQPTDATAAMGENYCVTVEAQGDGLTYQWYFKNAGTDVWHVSGVKDNTYDDVMIESRAGRQVYCVITDIWGNTVTTETVTLVCTDIPQAIAKN